MPLMLEDLLDFDFVDLPGLLELVLEVSLGIEVLPLAELVLPDALGVLADASFVEEPLPMLELLPLAP
jgi:hypothetical protein